MLAGGVVVTGTGAPPHVIGTLRPGRRAQEVSANPPMLVELLTAPPHACLPVPVPWTVWR